MNSPAPANGPDQWFVKVKDQVYGPYTLTTMRAFIAEGRVANQSMVADSKDGPFRAAGQAAPFSALFQKPQEWTTAAIVTESSEANLIICADFVTGGVQEFSRIVLTLGPSARIGQSTWVVRTTHTAASARSALARTLGRDDRLFICDATRERTAYMNLGPGAEVDLRGVWQAHR
ncbi:MAG: GYF domain-containing protein [Caulobacterales bacterium]